MNRKILLTVLALAAVLLATPYIGMVNADTGKGETKQDFKFVTYGFDHPGPNTKYWIADDGIFQARVWVWTPTFWELRVGGNVIPTVGYTSTMDMMLNLNTGDGTVRVHDTISFADGATLEIQTAETLRAWGTPAMVGAGSVVGHGTGSLEGVQVVGTTLFVYGDLGPTRVGTVMGWP